MTVESQPELTPEKADELARQFFDEVVREDERWLRQHPPEDPDDTQRRLEGAQQHRKGAKELLKIQAWDSAHEDAKQLLEGDGLSPQPESDAYRDFCMKLIRAAHEAARVRVGKIKGDWTVEPRDPLFKRRAPVGPDPGVTGSATASTPSADPALSLNRLIQQHLDDMKTKWTAQTFLQNAATLRLLQSFLGDRALTDVSRREIADFHRALGQLPRQYGQLPEFRDKTLNEMVELAERVPGSRLSQKTLNRHATAVSGLFRWARTNGCFDGESPASGFIDKTRGKGDGPKRRSWRRDELDRLVGELFRAEAPGASPIRSARLMVPLIALYTGMRLEEICKLTSDDIRQERDLWAIDVVGNASGRVKEESSNRTVPVHSMLVRLGFIEHVRAIETRGGGSLWPDLERQGPDAKCGWSISKWFTRFCTSIGVKSPGLTFHSFRKNMASALHVAGVPETTASDIMGHEHQTLTYRLYSEGPALRVLHEAVERVAYGIEIEQLDATHEAIAPIRPVGRAAVPRSRRNCSGRSAPQSRPSTPRSTASAT